MAFKSSLHNFTLSLRSSLRVKVLILIVVMCFCRDCRGKFHFFLFSPIPFYIKDWHFKSTSLHFCVNPIFY